jgi:CubicO group peptidase (beta-lactamase class C family)
MTTLGGLSKPRLARMRDIMTGHVERGLAPGVRRWDGGMGTSWWSDPAENIIGILLTQRLQFPPESPPYLDFWTSAYQAIDD